MLTHLADSPLILGADSPLISELLKTNYNKPMIKTNIFYQDLSMAKQEEVRQLVRQEIVEQWCDENEVDPRDYFEPSLDENQIAEIDERTDDYLNEHNTVVEYSI